MLGEFFAYYFGKSAGRRDERVRRRPRQLTRGDVVRARTIFVAVIICILVVAFVGVMGHSPY